MKLSRDTLAQAINRLVTTIRGAQQGQSLVVFAVMLVTIVAGTGLVIDTGYSYQQRRAAQNAADAASLAAAQYLSAHMGTNIPDSTMVSLLNSYANSNLSGSTITGWYVDANGTHIKQIGDDDYSVPAVVPGNPPTVSGVQVTVTRTHNTFFMRVLNLTTATVSAPAMARYGGVSKLIIQPDVGPQVIPFIVDDQSYWSSVNGCGTPYNTIPITFTASNGITAPFSCVDHASGFDWGPLNITTSNADSVIKTLLIPGNTYDNVPIIPMNSTDSPSYIQVSQGERATNFFNYMSQYWAGKTVVVPLAYHQDVVNDNCPNCSVRVSGFGCFHVSSANGNGNPKTVVGYWVNPASSDCPDLSSQGMNGGNQVITGPVTFGLVR